MSYVLIYGGMRLDLDEGVMRELKLRPGQHIPADQVAECIKTQARHVCSWFHYVGASEALFELSEWAFEGQEERAPPKFELRSKDDLA